MTTPYDPKRGVEALQRATGLGRETVRMAIRTGALPGYYVPGEGERGQYVVPEDAFRAFCRGEWVARFRPVFTHDIRPVQVVRNVS